MMIKVTPLLFVKTLECPFIELYQPNIIKCHFYTLSEAYADFLYRCEKKKVDKHELKYYVEILTQQRIERYVLCEVCELLKSTPHLNKKGTFYYTVNFEEIFN